MKKKIVFIMNPISGTASKASIPNLIDSILDKDRFEYEIRTTERAGHASEIASEAKEAHVDIVVLWEVTVLSTKWQEPSYTPTQLWEFCLVDRATDWLVTSCCP